MKTYKCCLCGDVRAIIKDAPVPDHGNNPEPLVRKKGALCCDYCNINKVVPYRIAVADFYNNK